MGSDVGNRSVGKAHSCNGERLRGSSAVVALTGHGDCGCTYVRVVRVSYGIVGLRRERRIAERDGYCGSDGGTCIRLGGDVGDGSVGKTHGCNGERLRSGARVVTLTSHGDGGCTYVRSVRVSYGVVRLGREGRVAKCDGYCRSNGSTCIRLGSDVGDRGVGKAHGRNGERLRGGA